LIQVALDTEVFRVLFVLGNRTQCLMLLHMPFLIWPTS